MIQFEYGRIYLSTQLLYSLMNRINPRDLSVASKKPIRGKEREKKKKVIFRVRTRFI